MLGLNKTTDVGYGTCFARNEYKIKIDFCPISAAFLTDRTYSVHSRNPVRDPD